MSHRVTHNSKGERTEQETLRLKRLVATLSVPKHGRRPFNPTGQFVPTTRKPAFDIKSATVEEEQPRKKARKGPGARKRAPRR